MRTNFKLVKLAGNDFRVSENTAETATMEFSRENIRNFVLLNEYEYDSQLTHTLFLEWIAPNMFIREHIKRCASSAAYFDAFCVINTLKYTCTLLCKQFM